jgi:hypothetical protein
MLPFCLLKNIKAKMDEWKLNDAQAFVELYHRAQKLVDDEPFYLEDPSYACQLSSHDLIYALQHQVKRMMESKVYVTNARETAMVHMTAIDPRLVHLANSSVTTLRDAASCMQERNTGRMARWQLSALLWQRAKRHTKLRKLLKLHKAHVEQAVDILDTFLFVEAIAKGDP